MAREDLTGRVTSRKAGPENSREASVGGAEGTGGLRGPGEISEGLPRAL